MDKMLILSIFSLVLSLNEALKNIGTQKCTGEYFDGMTYDKEILKETKDKPYGLAFDPETNKLFFSYIANNVTTSILDLTNNELSTITGLTGCGAVVEKKNHKVYFGCTDGLYEYDFEKKTAKNLHVTNESIWHLFSIDGAVYFTTFYNHKLYTYKNGEVKLVPELADSELISIGVAENKNLYFSNSTGLFVYKKDEQKSEYIGYNQPFCFATDNEGKLHFASGDRIYTIHLGIDYIEKIGRFRNIHSFVFDSNDTLIYSDNNAIVKLVRSRIQCYYL